MPGGENGGWSGGGGRKMVLVKIVLGGKGLLSFGAFQLPVLGHCGSAFPFGPVSKRDLAHRLSAGFPNVVAPLLPFQVKKPPPSDIIYPLYSSSIQLN